LFLSICYFSNFRLGGGITYDYIRNVINCCKYLNTIHINGCSHINQLDFNKLKEEIFYDIKNRKRNIQFKWNLPPPAKRPDRVFVPRDIENGKKGKKGRKKGGKKKKKKKK
jgi:hypothetical protein